VGGILPHLTLLMPAFSLPSAPSLPYGETSPLDGTLPYRCIPKGIHPTASVAGLSPVTFSAQASIDQ
jgi:hypothetical protein